MIGEKDALCSHDFGNRSFYEMPAEPGLFVCSACYLPEAFSTLASATPKCTESLDETNLEASPVNAACRINSQLAPRHLDSARSMNLKMMVPRRKHSLSGENRSALSLVKYQNPRFAISLHFVLSAVLGIAVPASAETSSLTEFWRPSIVINPYFCPFR